MSYFMADLFQVRKLNRLSDLGSSLRRQREQLGYSLTQISKRTLIAERYLQSIEQEDWQRLPGEIYVVNFLRRYALELSLDPVRVVKAYQVKSKQIYQSSISSLQRTLPLSSSNFLVLPKIIRNSIIALLAVALLGYLAWQVNDIFTPPELTIYSPTDNLLTADSQIVVSGQTEPEVEVKINDINIPVNAGSFSETIDLQAGLNILKISASKKYGKAQVIYRRIMWQPREISKN